MKKTNIVQDVTYATGVIQETSAATEGILTSIEETQNGSVETFDALSS